MPFTPEQLSRIFTRTNGRCHLCHGNLTLGHYGRLDATSGWEAEHSVPRAAGGTDHGNNLYAAHVSCNRSKGSGSTRAARAQNGFTRAPLSADRRQEVRVKNTLVGTGLGVALGAAFGGPLGALAVGLLGAAIGNEAAVG